MVDAALEVVRPKIEGRAINVVRRLTAGDDRTLADRPLLEQVFVNLLLNAADSMPEGGELTIAVRREPAKAGGAAKVDSADQVLCVEIADTGTGIDPEVLPHIFEPFFTTKPGGRGTGLGLSIATRIVDAHRGTVTVAARESGGTVFAVRIPVIPAGVKDGEPAEAQLTASSAE